jgi:hypothetical protein
MGRDFVLLPQRRSLLDPYIMQPLLLAHSYLGWASTDEWLSLHVNSTAREFRCRYHHSDGGQLLAISVEAFQAKQC